MLFPHCFPVINDVNDTCGLVSTSGQAVKLQPPLQCPLFIRAMFQAQAILVCLAQERPPGQPPLVVHGKVRQAFQDQTVHYAACIWRIFQQYLVAWALHTASILSDNWWLPLYEGLGNGSAYRPCSAPVLGPQRKALGVNGRYNPRARLCSIAERMEDHQELFQVRRMAVWQNGSFVPHALPAMLIKQICHPSCPGRRINSPTSTDTRPPGNADETCVLVQSIAGSSGETSAPIRNKANQGLLCLSLPGLYVYLPEQSSKTISENDPFVFPLSMHWLFSHPCPFCSGECHHFEMLHQCMEGLAIHQNNMSGGSQPPA